MSKDDINSLGSVYGGMLNGLKKDLIKEGKIGPSEIGDAALQTGGPTKEGGFAEAEVDIEKLTDKEKEDNLYNINKLSYTSSYMPEEDEEGKHDDKDGKKEKCDYVDCEEDKEDEEDAEEKIDLMNAFDKGTDPEDKDTDEDKLIDKKLFGNEEDAEERSDGTDDGECEECGGLGCEPCNGTGEKSEEDEEGNNVSVKQEVLNAVKHGAGEFAHKAAGMLQSAKELHAQYSEQGDQERVSILKSLINHFATQLKFDENEESSQISEKIAQDGLNNFMKQKSQFDSLYNKVMVSENFDEMESEDFDALGIDTEAQDEVEGGDEITVTLSKDVAQALCDVLQAAMGESDSEDGDEAEAATEGAFGEEDEEGIDTGSTHSGKYDDGKNNKVGDLKTAAAATAKGADSKLDSGSNLNTSYNDGKSNKVGSLSTGTRAVD